MTASGKHVLVVDDDPKLRELLRRYLSENQFEVSLAQDGPAMTRLMQRQPFDLIVLDLMLPGEDGLSIIRRLRGANDATPVIMLTAKGEEIDKVRGLDLGADDYVTKPFGLQELLARIQAVLRRKRKFDKELETVSFGMVTLDFTARTATVNKKPVQMTSREFDLLLFFLSREGEALERQEILNRVWGFDYFGTDRTVDNFINRLRQKLEPDPDKPKYFQTVRGVGYRFSREG